MRKKKLIAIMVSTIVCISAISISGTKIYADSKNTNTISVPKKAEIQKKEHFNQLIKIGKNNKLSKNSTDSISNINIDQYLDTLNTQELILTIAEFADEADKHNSSEELSMFVNQSTKKIVPNLSSKDYEEMLKSKDVNTHFKNFMIETAIYANKNDKSFNKQLRDIVKNSDNDKKLITYALAGIKDYDKSDVPMLTNILNSTSYKSDSKIQALNSLKSIDHLTTASYVNKILKNKEKYSQDEVASTMFVLSDLFRTSKNKEEHKKLFIENANNIMSLNNSRDLVEATVFSLGETGDKDALRIISNNRKVINEDPMIRYIADMNYQKINEMLEKTNNEDDIITALKLCEVARFDDFLPRLEQLKENQNKQIAKMAQDISSEIKASPMKRNKSWDNCK